MSPLPGARWPGAARPGVPGLGATSGAVRAFGGTERRPDALSLFGGRAPSLAVLDAEGGHMPTPTSASGYLEAALTAWQEGRHAEAQFLGATAQTMALLESSEKSQALAAAIEAFVMPLNRPLRQLNEQLEAINLGLKRRK